VPGPAVACLPRKRRACGYHLPVRNEPASAGPTSASTCIALACALGWGACSAAPAPATSTAAAPPTAAPATPASTDAVPVASGAPSATSVAPTEPTAAQTTIAPHPVLDVGARWFVIEGPRQEAPPPGDTRPLDPAAPGSPSYAKENLLGEPRRFTLVGPDGRVCEATARRRMALELPRRADAASRWVDAIEVEGCTGPRGGYRVALPGSALEALWRDPTHAPARGSASVQRLPGLTVEFVQPMPPRATARPGPLRAERGGTALAEWPGHSLRGLLVLRDRRWVVLADEHDRLRALGLSGQDLVGER
jgi:hypothetical protein